MKVLVIGSGGREHAIAWRLLQSRRISRIFVAPGNAGTALEAELDNVDLRTIPALVEFAKMEQIGLTIVGPEAPLAAGVVDAFRAANLKIFGPTQRAAQLESSKSFAKSFMQRHGIPTPAASTFEDSAAAHAYIDAHGAPVVIKADGLAAGKGVIVAQSVQEAHQAIDFILGHRQLGEAGARVLVEDFVSGEEASFIVMVDGRNVLPLATSQDHKRLLDGDLGPNTGGMGAYSPAPVIKPELHARIMREIIQPTVEGMAKEGERYTGFLYAGLMIDEKGHPHVLEFNCRMGDPETQPIMLRLKSDLVDLVEHAVNGTLDQIDAEWDRRTALGVVLAAPGYPGKPTLGARVENLPTELIDAHVFHAGTALKNGAVVTSGGRVLCVTTLGDNIKIARQRAYEIADCIAFEGCQLRRDIGARALQLK